jgi:hypothetical protein
VHLKRSLRPEPIRCGQLLDLHSRVDRPQWAWFGGQDGQPSGDRDVHRVGGGHIQAPGLVRRVGTHASPVGHRRIEVFHDDRRCVQE